MKVSKIYLEQYFCEFISIIAIVIAVMRHYIYVDKLYYALIVVLALLILVDFFRSKRNFGYINRYFLFVLISSSIYVFISAIDYSSIKFLIKYYIGGYLLLIYLYFNFMKFGKKYFYGFLKKVCFLLNLLSIFNLYQVFFHHPFLINYLKLSSTFNYQFNTSHYRTMSVFGHPIIGGLFFVIAFLLNIYIIKSPIKYIFQIILLVNIYSTKSRSAWIALSIVIILYGIIQLKNKRVMKLSLTYKKLFYVFVSLIILFIGSIYLFSNINTLINSIMTRFGDSLTLGTNSTDGSNLQRTMTISAILSNQFNGKVIHLFFGNGLTSSVDFMLSHQMVIPNFNTTDNQYLTWLYDLGLLPLIVYFSILIYLIRNLFKNRSWLCELSSLGLIALSVEIFFFELFYWSEVVFLFDIFTAYLTFNFINKKEKINNEEKDP